jgi:hypothetical protein
MVWMAGRERMAREGKIDVAVRGWPLQPRHFFIALFLSLCGAGHAAGSGPGTASPTAGGDPANIGAACQVGAPIWAPPAATAEDLPWATVWLGHFSGGRRFEDSNGSTLIDWRDDKLCFPSRQSCQAWTAGLRRAYRRPEGFWTCLVLR